MIAALVGKVQDEPDGVFRFQIAGDRDTENKPVSGYIRFAHQYAYLTYKDPATIALSRIPTPQQVVAGNPTAGVSFRLFMDRVPEVLRQQVLANVQQFKTLVSGNLGGGGPTMGLAIVAFARLRCSHVPAAPAREPAIRDGQELTLDVRFDRRL